MGTRRAKVQTGRRKRAAVTFGRRAEHSVAMLKRLGFKRRRGARSKPSEPIASANIPSAVAQSSSSTRIKVGSITCTIHELIGQGIWADVSRGTTQDGRVVAVKQLRELTERLRSGKTPPRTDQEQEQEMAIECALHMFMQGIAADAPASSCARVPKLLGVNGRCCAIEYIEGQSLESFLRKPRATMDANELANVARVCCIAVKKVLALSERARDNLFSHRDLNDGNIMIRLRDERVRAEEDVDVWLFDFGKSMAIVDGERTSAGIWDANGEQRILL